MRIYDIIDKKRHGGVLSKQELEFFINGYMKNEIADYQASSLLMAICIMGMNDEETLNLTRAMISSGSVVDLSKFGSLSVDKHSTGGVGDKTTLIIAPIVASLGLKVAKMSGRGLGFTGGTIDKLESLGDFTTSLSQSQFISQVEKIGVCVVGQNEALAPADKKLYALRDVTATVESVPLIASSIMSKKLASGASTIVLDVKVGSGAFMKNATQGKELASAMIKIGKGYGKSVCALITNMNIPLGYAIGNSLEVYEAISVLSGRGEERLRQVAIALSARMVSLSLGLDIEEATKMVEVAISSGKALEKLREWVQAQGGNTRYIDSPELLVGNTYAYEYKALQNGYISKINAESVGISSMLLGAGRTKKDQEIDHFAGILLKNTLGDYVKKGDTIATLYAKDKSLFEGSVKMLDSAISYSSSKPTNEPLIFDTVS
ncbi:MAG: thymidine phosphorylase [Clostridia bacterium]|nr:thymidine phosphorylase [Clostridia bacterium]